jgi:glycerophosphoryl diester phosphodiesterase
MAPRISSLRPPIGFAHRGASAHEPPNTLAAFRRAIELGASGLHGELWLTADGVAVLDHAGHVGLRRRRIASLERAALPGHIPSLEELYRGCGTGFELALEVADSRGAEAAVMVARAAANGAPGRLWLGHGDWRILADWRERFPDVRLIDTTRMRSIREGPERRASALAEARVDAVNLHHSDWTGGHTTLFHRFGVLAFARDAQLERVLDELLAMGIDGVFSDHTDRMAAAIARAAS